MNLYLQLLFFCIGLFLWQEQAIFVTVIKGLGQVQESVILFAQYYLTMQDLLHCHMNFNI